MVGFEPTVYGTTTHCFRPTKLHTQQRVKDSNLRTLIFRSAVFKTAALNHSANSPYADI